jgi:hypothetical protein
MQISDHGSIESYFDHYLDECILLERKRKLEKEHEEIKIQEEEELVEKEIQEQSEMEERTKKPRVAKNFLRMRSYRPDGAFEDEIEEIDSSDVPDEQSPQKEVEKIPYLI